MAPQLASTFSPALLHLPFSTSFPATAVSASFPAPTLQVRAGHVQTPPDFRRSWKKVCCPDHGPWIMDQPPWAMPGKALSAYHALAALRLMQHRPGRGDPAACALPVCGTPHAHRTHVQAVVGDGAQQEPSGWCSPLDEPVGLVSPGIPA